MKTIIKDQWEEDTNVVTLEDGKLHLFLYHFK